jgi:hypothetical protein
LLSFVLFSALSSSYFLSFLHLLHFTFTLTIIALFDLTCVSSFVWWTLLHKIHANFLISWFMCVLILFIVLVNLEELRQLRTKTYITRKRVNWSVRQIEWYFAIKGSHWRIHKKG